ncbi:hypothetical protein FNV43_RR26512 [Rhamnella rubrinervis]|uniref:Uncharacterized protein n=1 Tax=Rhamnella rubrinervis TaxID=2594499 RepID=A0A8K0DN45_9ROSA|nr:hypothetical protein FNV43_RR26512 [Rhamnella rubrinervis]
MESGFEQAIDLRNALSSLTLESNDVEASRVTERVLVGKMLSTRVFRRFKLMDIVRSSWQLKAESKLKRLQRMYSNFFSQKKRIETECSSDAHGPWMETSLSDIEFNTSTFYMQIHGLPSKLLHPGVAAKIGRQMGAGKCKFSEPATITNADGVVARLYGSWIRAEVAGEVRFINIAVSDVQRSNLIAEIKTFNGAATDHNQISSLVNTEKEVDKVSAIIDYNLGTPTEMNQICIDYFESIKAMCPEVDTLNFTIKDRFTGGVVDFQKLVIDKVRLQHYNMSQLSVWARKGIDMLAAAENYRRRKVSELELSDLEMEEADWLGIGKGRIKQAFGLSKASPVKLSSRKREALLHLERSYRGSIMGSVGERPSDSCGEAQRPSELGLRGHESGPSGDKDGGGIDIQGNCLVEEESTVTERESSDLAEVVIQLQETHVSPSVFNPGRSGSRYYTRPGQRQAETRSGYGSSGWDLWTANRGRSRYEQQRHQREDQINLSNSSNLADFTEAEEAGLIKPPLFRNLFSLEL